MNGDRDTQHNEWRDYAKLVLSELKRLNDWCNSNQKSLQDMRIEYTKNKHGFDSILGYYS